MLDFLNNFFNKPKPEIKTLTPNNIEVVEQPIAKELIINRSYLWSSGFYSNVNVKKKIMIHHTDGGGGALASMRYLEKQTKVIHSKQGYYVGVPFWIDRNGDIYQAFDEKYWSYHSGAGSQKFDQSCIGIELENIGFLDRNVKTGKITNRYGRPHLPFQKIYEHNVKWRNKILFEQYSEAQIGSLILLLDHLFNKYPTIPKRIPKDFFPEKKWNKSDYLNYDGILTHLHTNDTSKWDVSIAFKLWFDKIVNELNLETT